MNWRLLALVTLSVGCAATKQTVTYSETKFQASNYKCIVVAPFENMSRTQSAGLVVADSLANVFYNSRQFRVIERSEVQRYLAINHMDANIRMDPGQAVELGQALNADAVLIGTVTDFWYRSLDSKPEVSMALRIVDVKTQKVVYVASAFYEPQFISNGPVLLTAAAKSVADDLLGPLLVNIAPRDLGTSRCGLPDSNQPVMAAAPAPRVAPVVKVVEPPPPPVQSIEITEPVPSPATAPVSLAIVTPEPAPKPVAAEPVMTPAVFRLIRRMDDLKNFVVDDIVFELDKTSFAKTSGHVAFLQTLGGAMQSKPEIRIRFESHTDGLGDPDFNRQLSEQRSVVLKQHLVAKHGIAPSRIETAGHGGDHPLLPNINRKNREANRRVELVVLPAAQNQLAKPIPVAVPVAVPVAAPEPMVVGPDPVPAKVAEPVMTPAVFRLVRRMGDQKKFVVDDIVFEIDKTSFRGGEHEAFLGTLAGAMQSKPDLRIRIETHTDGLGDPNFNRQLTEQRSALLKQKLVTKYNIDPSRIETAGFGGERPLLPNINRKNREANRRVELVVIQGP